MIKLVVDTRDSQTKRLITAKFFNEIQINFKYDSVASTFKVQMFFDPSNAEIAELAAVSHIHECKLYYVHERVGTYAIAERNGRSVFAQTTDELIFTGFMLSQAFTRSSQPGFMEIGGYSKAGVLGDCDFPTRAYPIESRGLSFRQIVEQKVLPYFSNPKDGGFKFHIKSSRADSIFVDESTGSTGLPKNVADFINSLDDDADESIPKTTAPESKNILSYLTELAVQKGLVLSTDIFGNLVVNAPYTGDDYLFEIGTERGISYIDIACNYNGQGLHSDIEVVGQVPKDGGNMPYAIVTNPLVPVVYRPKVIKITAGTDNDCLKAAISERGTELKSIPLKITLPKPVANGKFIMPNNTIKVKERNVYLYEPSKWFIEEVVYTKNADGEKCEVTCVLPSAYDNSTPKNPFIDPHTNLPRI